MVGQKDLREVWFLILHLGLCRISRWSLYRGALLQAETTSTCVVEQIVQIAEGERSMRSAVSPSMRVDRAERALPLPFPRRNHARFCAVPLPRWLVSGILGMVR